MSSSFTWPDGVVTDIVHSCVKDAVTALDLDSQNVSRIVIRAGGASIIDVLSFTCALVQNRRWLDIVHLSLPPTLFSACSLQMCESIGYVLRHTSVLRTLHLNGCRMCPEGWRQLVAGLKSNRSLRHLILSDTNLDQENFESLLDALIEKQNLRVVDLSRNILGDVLEALLNALGEHCIIHVDDCGITESLKKEFTSEMLRRRTMRMSSQTKRGRKRGSGAMSVVHKRQRPRVSYTTLTEAVLAHDEGETKRLLDLPTCTKDDVRRALQSLADVPSRGTRIPERVLSLLLANLPADQIDVRYCQEQSTPIMYRLRSNSSKRGLVQVRHFGFLILILTTCC